MSVVGIPSESITHPAGMEGLPATAPGGLTADAGRCFVLARRDILSVQSRARLDIDNLAGQVVRRLTDQKTPTPMLPWTAHYGRCPGCLP